MKSNLIQILKFLPFPLFATSASLLIVHLQVSEHITWFTFGELFLLIISLILCVFALLDLKNSRKKYNKEKEEVDEFYNIAKEAILNNKVIQTQEQDFLKYFTSSQISFGGKSNIKPLDKLEDESQKISSQEILKPSHTYKNLKSKKSDDVLQMMALNMREIKEYYFLSKNMAKKSFNLSMLMCVLGFLTIASSIIFLFFTDINFIEALIPIIGGTIVEIIAGTSLVVYNKSLEQLNKYYDSLHNNEKFLSLVNLVDKLSDDKKDEVYIDIINNQLQALNGIDTSNHAESK